MHDLGHTAPLLPAAAIRIDRGRVVRVDEMLAEETPVSMVYNGAAHAVMMATPSDLEDFAIGFSLTEGLIRSAADLTRVTVVRHNKGIELQMETSAELAGGTRSRRLSGRTGCGICGMRDVEEVLRKMPVVHSDVRFPPAAIACAMDDLARRQPFNDASGGVHAAAWASVDGEIAYLREDVGRHNALDKVVGAMSRAGRDASTGFVVMTSRGSFELVQKVAFLGVALLATVSAPTALAVRMAGDAGITLAGFARDGRVTVYTRPDRVIV